MPPTEPESRDDLAKRLRAAAMPLAKSIARRARCDPDDLIADAYYFLSRNCDPATLECPEGTFVLYVQNIGKRWLKDMASARSLDSLTESERERLVADLAPELSREVANWHEAFDELRKEIAKLPASERDVMLLYLDHVPLPQIAEQTNRPLGSVYSQYERAKAKLRSSGRLKAIVAHLTVFPLAVWDRCRSWSGRNVVTTVVGVAIVGGFGAVMAIHVLAEPDHRSDQSRPNRDGSVVKDEPQSTSTNAGTGPAAPAATRSDDVQAEQPTMDEGEARRDVTGPDKQVQPRVEPSPLPPKPSELRTLDPNDATITHVVKYHPGTEVVARSWTEINGKKHGAIKSYRSDGTLKQIASVKDGLPHGLTLDFDESGTKVVRETLWEAGKHVK